jgi:hypothetical protein
MIIRLSGGERKPGSRLSVLELSIRNIEAENESEKIRNAETGKLAGKKNSISAILSEDLSRHYGVAPREALKRLSFFMAENRERNIFQENFAGGFTKLQSSFPTDLHLAKRQKRFQVSAVGLEQQRIEAEKLLTNLVPPPVDRAAER